MFRRRYQFPQAAPIVSYDFVGYDVDSDLGIVIKYNLKTIGHPYYFYLIGLI
jgi:hypothetical protein